MSHPYAIGDIWYVKYPLEEDPSKYIERPAIIADVQLPEVAVIKITKREPRYYDRYDTLIFNYQAAHLKYISTARVSKFLIIHKNELLKRLGALHPEDSQNIFDKLNDFLDKVPNVLVDTHKFK